MKRSKSIRRSLASQIEHIASDDDLLLHAKKLLTDMSSFSALDPLDISTQESAQAALAPLQARLEKLTEHARKVSMVKQLLAQRKFELEFERKDPLEEN